MKFCTKCGKELHDEAVICTGCGCMVGGKLGTPKLKNPKTEKIKQPKIKEAKTKGDCSITMQILSFFSSITAFIAALVIAVTFVDVRIYQTSTQRCTTYYDEELCFVAISFASVSALLVFINLIFFFIKKPQIKELFSALKQLALASVLIILSIIMLNK